MRADIISGAVFPDYELSDHRGTHRTLSELQGGNPLVLSRGGFCPTDRRQHEGGAASSLGEGRQGGFSSVRKNAGAGVGRTGLIDHWRDRERRKSRLSQPSRTSLHNVPMAPRMRRLRVMIHTPCCTVASRRQRLAKVISSSG
jgi:hypothetical protein